MRASLIAEGRSITLYEEAHSKKKENNDKVHKDFLEQLKSILPEASFRDHKSTQFGFSMNENVTLIAKRYITWLLIASLASFIAWVVGYAAEQKKLHYQFQANTYRHSNMEVLVNGEWQKV